MNECFKKVYYGLFTSVYHKSQDRACAKCSGEARHQSFDSIVFAAMLSTRKLPEEVVGSSKTDACRILSTLTTLQQRSLTHSEAESETAHMFDTRGWVAGACWCL